MAWAACCAQLLRAVAAQVRSGEVGVRQSSSVLDRVAARIAFGVLALTSLGGPLSLAAGAGASPPPVGPRPGTSLTAAVPAGTAWTRRPRCRAGPTPCNGATRSGASRTKSWATVRTGRRWPRSNLGHDVGGGARFVDPDRLREGWRLRLPPDARPPVRRQRRDTRTNTGTRAASKGQHPEPEGHLPELIALGLGSAGVRGVGAAGRTRRRMSAQFTGEPVLAPASSESALDTATLLQRFRGVPALHSFEAANCLLGLSLQGRTSGPPVRAICVSDTGVTFCFAREHPDDPPAGFARVQDGAGWHVGHAALDGQDPSFPTFPWCCRSATTTRGPGSSRSNRAMCCRFWARRLQPSGGARAAVGSWAWSQMILVAEDPEDPALAAEAAADPFLARRVLFCGDPASLPPSLAARCAVVTMDPVAASDLTVLVDRQAATMHPMGQVLRPHLQSVEIAEQIAELVAQPTEDERDRQSKSPARTRMTRRALEELCRPVRSRCAS